MTIKVDFDSQATEPTTVVVVDKKTGNREVKTSGIRGKDYVSQDAVYTKSGQLLSLQRYDTTNALTFSQVENPNGSELINTYLPDGTHITRFDNVVVGLQYYTEYRNAGGQVFRIESKDQYGEDASFIDTKTGDSVDYSKQPGGGSSQTYLFPADKPYYEQDAFFANGKIVELRRIDNNTDYNVIFDQRFSPDGSSTLDSVDESTSVSTHIDYAADGSRDVVISGALQGHVTQEHDHYGSDDKKVLSDLTFADGSHKQTAFASGVSLTATANRSDTLTAAPAGGDTFVFRPAFGQDIITNFHAGSGASHDVVDFTAFHAQLGSAQSQSDYLAQHLKQVGSAAVLTIAPNEVLTLKNTPVASLNRDNVLI